ncbi:MAG: hypothetical protein AB7J35_00260 [Dehalococcoidia bacterium]
MFALEILDAALVLVLNLPLIWFLLFLERKWFHGWSMKKVMLASVLAFLVATVLDVATLDTGTNWLWGALMTSYLVWAQRRGKSPRPYANGPTGPASRAFQPRPPSPASRH